jgi:phage terminase small subunit
MDKRGPKPKPAAFKILHGNPGKREIPPEPKAYGALSPPDWLDGLALEKWNELAPDLEKTMGAAFIDSDTLTVYCYLWAKFVRLMDNHLVVPEHNRTIELMRKFGSVLGLSPSDRVGLGTKESPTKLAKEFLA